MTPQQLPEWATVCNIETSPHEPATAYLAATRYKLDDSRPYLYKTNDQGKTWKTIIEGIPGNESTRVIREDPARKGLLYAATERGVYVSLDDGELWQSLQRNLPTVPVHDLVIKDNDLVAATHGRSFWILDDLTQLHQLTDEVLKAPVHLFNPRPTYRMPPLPEAGKLEPGPGKNYMVRLGVPATFRESKTQTGETVRTFLDAGQNPPDGVVVTYCLRQTPDSEVTLTFLESDGREVKRFSSETTEEETDSDTLREPRVSVKAGMNRFVWNMHYPDAHKVPGDGTTKGSLIGPIAKPGTYLVRLSAEGQTYTQSFEIRKDPRIDATQEDLNAQFALLTRIRDRLSETHDTINELRSVRRQVDEWVMRATDHPAAQMVSDRAEAVTEKLNAIEEQIIQTKSPEGLDRLHLHSRLNAKLADLTNAVASADAVPTQQSYEVFEDLSGRIGQHIQGVRQVVDEDIATFMDLIHELEIPPIVPSAST